MLFCGEKQLRFFSARLMCRKERAFLIIRVSYATKSMPVEWVPHGFVIEIEGSIEATLLTKLQKICLSYYSVRQKKI